MIQIIINIDKAHLGQSIKTDLCTMAECGIAIYSLEQIKKDLLELKFDGELEVTS